MTLYPPLLTSPRAKRADFLNPIRDTQSVTYYGAVGDGVTDDTAAIQAAIDANIGRRVLFPAGTYLTTSRLVLKSNTHLCGESHSGAMLKPSAAVTNAAIIGLSADAVTLVTVEDIRIDCSNMTSGVSAIMASRASNVIIKDCIISGSKHVAIQLLGCTEGRIEGCTVNNSVNNGISIDDGCRFCSVQNNKVSNPGTFGVHVGNAGNGSFDCVVSNNIIDAGPNFENIGVTPDCRRIVVSGNVCNGPSGDNNISMSGNDCTVVGNSCISALKYGIQVLGANCTVGDNVVQNAGWHGIYVDGFGIVTVTGNTVSMCGYSGITCVDAVNVTINGNVCFDNNQVGGVERAGVYLVGSSGVVVTGNRCFDQQTPKTQNYGLYSDGSECKLTGNDFSGNKTGHVYGAENPSSVKDYGAVGDGVTDDTAALTTAFAAGAGILERGATYLVSGNGFALPHGLTTKLHIVGHGATIKAAAGSAMMAHWDTSTAGRTFKNISIEGVTFDANNIWMKGISYIGYARANFADITLRDCDFINGVYNEDEAAALPGVTIICGAPSTATSYSVKRIAVENCHVYGFGGGVYIGTGDNANNANCVVDAVRIHGCTFDSLITHTKEKFTSGFIIGVRGWIGSVSITDCIAVGSGDNGFEIDNAFNGVISNCQSVNPWNAGYTLRNIGNTEDAQQLLRVTGCTHRASSGFTGGATHGSHPIYINGVTKITQAGNSWQFASTTPTVGLWVVGDVVYNSAPSTGEYIGWVCVTTGWETSAVWKGFGLIE